MRAAVNDVESRGGEDVGGFDTGEFSKVLVEGNVLFGCSGLCNSDGDAKDGVCTEPAFVGGTVKLDKEVVDFLLLGDREAGVDEGGSDHVVDVGNGLGNAYKEREKERLRDIR